MSNEAAPGVKPIIFAETDTDVGTGSPSTLTGFPTNTIGYQGAGDKYNQYDFGVYILARNPAGAGSRLYLVSPNGAGGKVAALVATMTGSPGGGSAQRPSLVLLAAPIATDDESTFPALSGSNRYVDAAIVGTARTLVINAAISSDGTNAVRFQLQQTTGVGAGTLVLLNGVNDYLETTSSSPTTLTSGALSLVDGESYRLLMTAMSSSTSGQVGYAEIVGT